MPENHFAITLTENPMPEAERAAVLANPGFGVVFTDHMVTMYWSVEKGWHDGAAGPRKPFLLDPATTVLHYGQEIFEGLKAYRSHDGGIVLFRPEENGKRFMRSAQRLAMAPLPVELFVEAIEQLVRLDHEWLPSGDGQALYLRPFMFSSEKGLGVKPSNEYTFCVIACPVGAYFKGGQTPITVWVSSDYIRAAKGGTGAAKCGGNYAAGLLAHQRSVANGCDQTVFLDAAERKWVEELGGMNIFFVTKDKKLITPPLSGTILEGITRDSILTLGAGQGLTVEEMPYSYPQWKEDAASGYLTEAFACGTAAVIVPIGIVRDEGGDFTMGNGQVGPVTAALYDCLVNLHRGRGADNHQWLHRIEL